MNIRDYFIEVQRGNIEGHTVVHKFGSNTSIKNGVWDIVSSSSPSGTFPASGVKVRIKAGGNVADTVDGIGAHDIHIIGINTDLIEVRENIVTSGANASLLTTNNFWRIYRAHVLTVGTYTGSNVGDIVIEDSDGNNDMLTITAEEGQTQHGAFSIPLGKTGYLISVTPESDSSKAADFRVFIRENFNVTSGNISPKRLVLYFDGVLGQFSSNKATPNIKLNSLTDIWVEAEGGGANTEVSIDFEILLIDDPSGPIKSI